MRILQYPSSVIFASLKPSAYTIVPLEGGHGRLTGVRNHDAYSSQRSPCYGLGERTFSPFSFFGAIGFGVRPVSGAPLPCCAGAGGAHSI